MSKLIVYYGDQPESVEGFSDSCKRSCQGALHLQPRKPKTVSDDEFEHIKTARGDVFSKIRKLAEKPDGSAEQKAEVKSEPETKVSSSDKKAVSEKSGSVSSETKDEPVETGEAGKRKSTSSNRKK